MNARTSEPHGPVSPRRHLLSPSTGRSAVPLRLAFGNRVGISAGSLASGIPRVEAERLPRISGGRHAMMMTRCRTQPEGAGISTSGERSPGMPLIGRPSQLTRRSPGITGGCWRNRLQRKLRRIMLVCTTSLYRRFSHSTGLRPYMTYAFPMQPDPDHAASPIVGWIYNRNCPETLPPHCHRRGQLLHVERGVMVVTVGHDSWVVPPHRAFWVPGGIEHGVRYPDEVALRALFIDQAALEVQTPTRCAVLALDALAREMVRTIARLPWHATLEGPGQRLIAALMDRLWAVQDDFFHLPVGQDRRLVRVTELLRRDPSDNRSIEALAKATSCSSRTLARLFWRETGMSFGAWRQQLRLQVAVRRLASGDSVTSIAGELGYGTPSSFSTMFRRSLGVPPAQYLAVLGEAGWASRASAARSASGRSKRATC
jgi:AraC-like DNA-binding protein/mannose-6-phosphate isomerase-like protein (cupin superfamily)